jgi:2,3-bisphosphoglycerate-independent phosphoglycerate mutase
MQQAHVVVLQCMLQRLRKEQFIYERDVAQLNEQIAKDYTREMREVLSEIRQAIKSTSENYSFDLVLRSPDTDNPKVTSSDPKVMTDPAEKEKQTYLQLTAPQTVAEVLERFHRNPVLFGATTVDITDEVLRNLNAAFRKRGALK